MLLKSVDSLTASNSNVYAPSKHVSKSKCPSLWKLAILSMGLFSLKGANAEKFSFGNDFNFGNDFKIDSFLSGRNTQNSHTQFNNELTVMSLALKNNVLLSDVNTCLNNVYNNTHRTIILSNNDKVNELTNMAKKVTDIGSQFCYTTQSPRKNVLIVDFKWKPTFETATPLKLDHFSSRINKPSSPLTMFKNDLSIMTDALKNGGLISEVDTCSKNRAFDNSHEVTITKGNPDSKNLIDLATKVHEMGSPFCYKTISTNKNVLQMDFKWHSVLGR